MITSLSPKFSFWCLNWWSWTMFVHWWILNDWSWFSRILITSSMHFDWGIFLLLKTAFTRLTISFESAFVELLFFEFLICSCNEGVSDLNNSFTTSLFFLVDVNALFGYSPCFRLPWLERYIDSYGFAHLFRFSVVSLSFCITFSSFCQLAIVNFSVALFNAFFSLSAFLISSCLITFLFIFFSFQH